MPQPNNIPLFAVRTLSETFNATFDFVRANWRIWLRWSIYLLLPLAVFQGLGLASLSSDFSDDYVRSSTSFMFAAVPAVLAIAATITLALALMMLHHQRNGDINDLTLADLWPMMRRYGPSVLLIVVLVSLISIALLVLAVPLLIMMLPIGLAVLAAMPSFLLWPAACALGEQNLVNGFADAIKAGFANWGRLVGLFISMGITLTVLQQTTWLPLVGASMLVKVYTNDPTQATGWWEIAINVSMTLFSILHCFTSYLSIAFMAMALNYFYASHLTATGRKAITDTDIDDFENL